MIVLILINHLYSFPCNCHCTARTRSISTPLLGYKYSEWYHLEMDCQRNSVSLYKSVLLAFLLHYQMISLAILISCQWSWDNLSPGSAVMVAMGNLKEWIGVQNSLLTILLASNITFTRTCISYTTSDTLHARSSLVTKLYTISHADFWHQYDVRLTCCENILLLQNSSKFWWHKI